MCDNCMHKPVCSKYRATGGVKTCEHHKEERRGHWVEIPKDMMGYEWGCRCSLCGCYQNGKNNYCANCGADMRGAADGKE